MKQNIYFPLMRGTAAETNKVLVFFKKMHFCEVSPRPKFKHTKFPLAKCLKVQEIIGCVSPRHFSKCQFRMSNNQNVGPFLHSAVHGASSHPRKKNWRSADWRHENTLGVLLLSNDTTLIFALCTETHWGETLSGKKTQVWLICILETSNVLLGFFSLMRE